MDTTGFDQVGRYGTLSLLKKRLVENLSMSSTATSTQASSSADVITSFGVDNSNLTFGREPTCDVRLYYPTVDPVHCRVINEDGKAFMVVQGKTGVLIDGCWVYPHTSSSIDKISQESPQTIVPLTNNSEFEIHGKRFRFAYPPKEIRKVLLDTPVTQRNRKLRLSMIQSAQVFTPRPSKDPRVNLRILQTPLKSNNIFATGTDITAGSRSRSTSPHKPRAVSPLKFGISADDSDSDEASDEEEQDENEEGRGRSENEDHIVLVHTNHPRVVEEDQDLVILEDVPLRLILPSPSIYANGSPAPRRTVTPQPGTPSLPQPAPLQPQPQQAQPQPPRTPKRKSVGGTALHRAVLIRSAQRAVWKAEREREEEEEEMEVLGVVVDDGDDGTHRVKHPEYETTEIEDVEMADPSDEDVGIEEEMREDEEREGEGYSDEEEEDDDDDENALHRHDNPEHKPLWRKSLERIIPWPFGSKKEDEAEGNEGDEDEESDEGLSALPQPTPARRLFGSFMTPQPQHAQPLRRNLFPNADASSSATGANTGSGRFSLGGGEARRVLVQQPWKLKDLVVPPIASSSTDGSTVFSTLELGSKDPPKPFIIAPPTSPIKTAPAVTDEERRAIQERRRSAVQDFRQDSFWKDGAPGMSPTKVRPSPAKPPTGLGVGVPGSASRPSDTTRGRPLFGSPTKVRALDYAIAEVEKEEGDSVFFDNKKQEGTSKGSSNSSSKVTPAPGSSAVDDDDDSLDTHGLLERMRETVEDMKRRRSIATPARPTVMPATPIESENSLFRLTKDSNEDASPSKEADRTGKRAPGSIKKLDFTRMATLVTFKESEKAQPVVSQHLSRASVEPNTSKDGDDDEMEDGTAEPEPFRLLRPDTETPTPVPQENEQKASDIEGHALLEPQLLPAVVINTVEEEQHDVEFESREAETDVVAVTGKTRGRSRLLRAPKKDPDVVMEPPVQTDNVNPEEEEHQPKPNALFKPPSSTTQRPRSRAVKSPVPTAEELSEKQIETVPDPSKLGARRGRSKSKTPQLQAAESTELPELSKPNRKGRSQTPQAPVEAEGDTEQEIESGARSTRRRATRQGTAEVDEQTVEEQSTAAKRRGKKATEQLEKATDTEDAPATVKRGRRPRTVATVIEEPEAEQAVPVTKSGGQKKVKGPEPIAEPGNEDDDELDSYEINKTIPARRPTVAATSSSKKSSNDNKVRSIPQPTKSRKKETPIPIKEETKEEDTAPPLAATRSGRGTRANTTTMKTPATTTKSKSKIPAVATGAKPRGRPKTPATAPAASTAGPSTNARSEKENTPGAGSGSNGSDEGNEEVAVVKVRVTRKANTTSASTKQSKSATTKAKVKLEEDNEEKERIEKTTARTTRVMRTRTKTG